jgi:hypothetical protein
LTPALKLAGFLVLLAAVFVGAHLAGTGLGPVTTGHTHVQYTGGPGGSGMSGMTPGSQP